MMGSQFEQKPDHLHRIAALWILKEGQPNILKLFECILQVYLVYVNFNKKEETFFCLILSVSPYNAYIEP